MLITGKKAGFILKFFLFGMVTSALIAGCLNPISFNSDDLPAIPVIGEISIDNINSAELNFRNHTLSVDVTRIDIIQHRVEKSSSGGQPTTEDVDKLDARISGSPTSGTQDSVLVRPTGTNVTNDLEVKSYTIQVWYRKAQNIPDELEGKFSDLSNEGNPLEVELNELPRGRCVLHVYRNKTTEKIAIDVEGATDDPDYNDHRFDDDFVMNVKTQTKVDLSGLEVSVSLPPQIEVTFSQEIIDAVNAAFGELSHSMDKVATSINDLALIVESSRLFGKDTGLLVVKNWSPKPVTVEATLDNRTYGIGPVHTGDLDGKLLSTKDASKYSVKVLDENQSTIETKNTFVLNQRVSYLHVYVDQTGKTVSDITESSERPNDAKLGYGRLRVKNYTDVEITNIMFMKKIGSGAEATYDNSKSFIVQKVGPGSEAQYSSVASNKVEEGNYAVFCHLADGRVVFNAFDFYLLADDVAYQAGDNVLEILPSQLQPVSTTIMYTIIADGGPPAANDADLYNTTKLTITFSAPPSSPFTFVKTDMASTDGSITMVTNLQYEVEITDPVNETAKFKLDGTDIDDSEHLVTIYKKDAPPPSFIPVTDVVVNNGVTFTKGTTPKTIDWTVLPLDATNRNAFWTLGELDLNLKFAGFLWGGTPPYGLGSDGKQDTDPQGRLTVRTSWNQDYLNLAVIVENGKAQGARSPKLNQLSAPVIDKSGNTISITIQALRYDPDKDFVKVFRFNN
ncbi:MAG: hypothetical protein LBJ24_07385 [Treponema sp.]|jgi:hypothetical protein|nr:hypothetical protein [Treponema sp.]